MREMKQITPDFRMSEPTLTVGRDGQTYRTRLCEELIEGRWEGFVSMEPVAETGSIQ